MSDWLTDERIAYREAIRDFAARECGTRERQLELTDGWREDHSREIYAKLGALGWIGSAFPEEYGGAGGGAVDACLFLEETFRALVPIFGAGTSLIVGKTVEKFGTEEQKQDILGSICRGAVASIAMSEPEAGSDVGALSCRADRVPGGYVVNGQKTWISNAHHAERILLVCRTDKNGSKHEGISMLDLPVSTVGVEVRLIETMGSREVNDVYFTDAFVPQSGLLGREGEAWGQLMAGLNFERLVTAAMSLGNGERAFEDILSYVKERRQFGRPIGQFQVLKHRLADLATELECCRLLVYDVAIRADKDPAVQMPREASMAKLKVTETTRKIALEGIQMMGGYGYSTEYDMERLARSSLAATIYAGTSEIQREIIGGSYGL